MPVVSLNLEKVLLHHISGGIGIAVSTEICAGVVHADILALDATALLSLPLVLESPVAHDRNGLVELREEARLCRDLLLFREEGHEGVVFRKVSGKKLAVDAAVSLDSEAAQVDLFGAGGDGKVPAMVVPIVPDLPEPLGDLFDLRIGGFGKRDVLCGIERRRFRDEVSLVVGGSVRSSADVVKAIALGADACYIGTAALLALGCHLCRSCHTGLCNWGIATQRPDLVKRLNPDLGYKRLVNLVTAWKHEIEEMMGGMGINSLEALRGNRLMLRGIGLTDTELRLLGVRYAGESL